MTTSNNPFQNYTLEGEDLRIYTYPSAILKQVAKPVTDFGEDLQKLAKNMLYTMYRAPGIGLAAPQVGVSLRMFVMDIDFDREEITKADESEEYEYSNFNPLVIINPEFLNPEGEVLYEEGCLSVPGVYEQVKRSNSIEVKYQNLSGDYEVINAEGLLSICLQHENDHLDGIVFLERLSQLKQSFLKKKFLKQKKKQAQS